MSVCDELRLVGKIYHVHQIYTLTLMEINEAIEKERVIEIGIKRPDNYDSVYYSGVCLKATKNIWMIINYNIDINTFDGFTVFRNTDVEAYSVFIKKDLPKADKKQFYDLKTAVHIG